MSKKIIMCKGLPASGKSTLARKMVQDNPGSYTRVNKDDLRAMMHGGRWSKINEKIVLETRDLVVASALTKGQHVIVDDTNFHPKHEEKLRDLAKAMDAQFEEKFFDKRPELCIKHDLKRENSVGRDVIMDMYNKYLKPEVDTYTPPVGRAKAIIVDIDGTLAHMNGRSPYDYTKVMTDKVDEKIKTLVNMYHNNGYVVVIVSGRANDEFGHATNRTDIHTVTSNWLKENGIEFEELWLRKSGDERKDVIVKREIFDECIRDKYDIELVLDDRNQTVEGWRQLGLKTLQVAEGNF